MIRIQPFSMSHNRLSKSCPSKCPSSLHITGPSQCPRIDKTTSESGIPVHRRRGGRTRTPSRDPACGRWAAAGPGKVIAHWQAVCNHAVIVPVSPTGTTSSLPRILSTGMTSRYKIGFRWSTLLRVRLSIYDPRTNRIQPT